MFVKRWPIDKLFVFSPPAFNKKREIFVHSENFVCNYDNRAKLYIANIAAIRYNISLKEWALAKKTQRR